MSTRDINLIPILNKVIEATQGTFTTGAVDVANFLIDKVYEFWGNEALLKPQRKDGKPSLWGEKYKSTLKVDMITGKSGTARVYVDESHPNYKFVEMVENGVTSWSIKDALLSGKAARRNKAIYGTAFVRVPFKHKTPGVSKATSSFSSTMPTDVYEQAKKGVSLGKEYGDYAGLKKYSSGVHSQYMTFRTVSANSEGWIYPNKPATPVYNDVQKRVEKMIEGAIINLIQGVGKDIQKGVSK